MAITVASTSEVVSTGNVNVSAWPAVIQIPAPSGLAVGDYYVIGVLFAQSLAQDVDSVDPDGFTRLVSSRGTTNARLVTVYGRRINNQADLDASASTWLRAGATATRVVGLGLALRGVDANNPVAGLDGVRSVSGTYNTLAFDVPSSGEFYGFCYSNNTFAQGVPNHTAQGGSRVHQAISYATGSNPSNTVLSAHLNASAANMNPAGGNPGTLGVSFNPAPVTAPAYSGLISLTGAGSFAASGKPTFARIVGLTASGTAQTTARPRLSAGLGFSGAGNSSSSTVPRAKNLLPVSGSGTLSTSALSKLRATLGLSGSGSLTLTGDGEERATGQLNLSGSGVLSATSRPAFSGHITTSGDGSGSTSQAPCLRSSLFLNGEGQVVVLGVAGGGPVPVSPYRIKVSVGSDGPTRIRVDSADSALRKEVTTT